MNDFAAFYREMRALERDARRDERRSRRTETNPTLRPAVFPEWEGIERQEDPLANPFADTIAASDRASANRRRRVTEQVDRAQIEQDQYDRSVPFGLGPVVRPFVNAVTDPDRRESIGRAASSVASAFNDWMMDDEPVQTPGWLEALRGLPESFGPSANEALSQENLEALPGRIGQSANAAGNAISQGYDWVSRQADPEAFPDGDFIGGVGTLARDYGPGLIRAATYGPWENERAMQRELNIARGMGEDERADELADEANIETGWGAVNMAAAPFDIPAAAQGLRAINPLGSAGARAIAETAADAPRIYRDGFAETTIEPDGRIVHTYQGAYESGGESGAEALQSMRAAERALLDDIAENQRPEYYWSVGPDAGGDPRLAEFYRDALRRRTPSGYIFSEEADGTMRLTREDAGAAFQGMDEAASAASESLRSVRASREVTEDAVRSALANMDGRELAATAQRWGVDPHQDKHSIIDQILDEYMYDAANGGTVRYGMASVAEREANDAAARRGAQSIEGMIDAGRREDAMDVARIDSEFGEGGARANTPLLSNAGAVTAAGTGGALGGYILSGEAEAGDGSEGDPDLTLPILGGIGAGTIAALSRGRLADDFASAVGMSGARPARNAGRQRMQAAVRDPETGQVYTGANHAEAIDAAPQAVQARLYALDTNGPDVGFTRGDEFLTREEAMGALGEAALPRMGQTQERNAVNTQPGARTGTVTRTEGGFVADAENEIISARRVLRGDRDLSLREWAARRGGVRDDRGDLADLNEGRYGSHRIVRSAGGRTLDDLAVMAWEDGYFTEVPTRTDLIDALRANSAGRLATGTSDEAVARQAARDTITRYEAMGVDTNAARRTDLRAQLEQVTPQDASLPRTTTETVDFVIPDDPAEWRSILNAHPWINTPSRAQLVIMRNARLPNGAARYSIDEIAAVTGYDAESVKVIAHNARAAGVPVDALARGRATGVPPGGAAVPRALDILERALRGGHALTFKELAERMGTTATSLRAQFSNARSGRGNFPPELAERVRAYDEAVDKVRPRRGRLPRGETSDEIPFMFALAGGGFGGALLLADEAEAQGFDPDGRWVGDAQRRDLGDRTEIRQNFRDSQGRVYEGVRYQDHATGAISAPEFFPIESGGPPRLGQTYDSSEIPLRPEEIERIEALRGERGQSTGQPGRIGRAAEEDEGDTATPAWSFVPPLIAGVIGGRYGRRVGAARGQPRLGELTGAVGAGAGTGLVEGALTEAEDIPELATFGGGLGAIGRGGWVASERAARAGAEALQDMRFPQLRRNPRAALPYVGEEAGGMIRPPPAQQPSRVSGSLDEQELAAEMRTRALDQGRRRLRPTPVAPQQRLPVPHEQRGSLANRLEQLGAEPLRDLARREGLPAEGTVRDLAVRLAEAARNEPDRLLPLWQRLYPMLGIGGGLMLLGSEEAEASENGAAPDWADEAVVGGSAVAGAILARSAAPRILERMVPQNARIGQMSRVSELPFYEEGPAFLGHIPRGASRASDIDPRVVLGGGAIAMAPTGAGTAWALNEYEPWEDQFGRESAFLTDANLRTYALQAFIRGVRAADVADSDPELAAALAEIEAASMSAETLHAPEAR